MKFNNRPNECVELPDGRTVWLSRSVAVTASIVLLCDERAFVLVNQRGPGLPNYVGYWNLPCGYLDYDENTEQAARREVWEECGIAVEPLLSNALVNYFSRAWDVHSEPRDQKQNVSIHHGLVANVSSLPETSTQYCEANEVTEVRWQELGRVPQLRYAFHHQRRISEFIKITKNELGDQCPAALTRYPGFI